jgi:hypothetical protein
LRPRQYHQLTTIPNKLLVFVILDIYHCHKILIARLQVDKLVVTTKWPKTVANSLKNNQPVSLPHINATLWPSPYKMPHKHVLVDGIINSVVVISCVSSRKNIDWRFFWGKLFAKPLELSLTRGKSHRWFQLHLSA